MSRDIQAGRAFVVLDAKKDPLTAGLKAAGADIKRWVGGVSSAIRTIRSMASGLVETAEHIDKIAKGAEKLGVSTQSFVALEHAANLADVSIETLERSFFKMQQTLVKTPKKFEELGLNIEELRNMAPDKQFEAMADAISKIDDAADRSAAAFGIFGKSAQDLLPLFAEGSEGIEKARKETEAYGIAVGKLDANQIEEMNDAVTRLKASWSGFSVSLTASLAGPLTDWLDFFTDFVSRIKEATSWIQRIKIVLEAFSGGVDLPDNFADIGPITASEKHTIRRLKLGTFGGAPEPEGGPLDKKLKKKIEADLKDLKDDATEIFEDTRLPEENLVAQLEKLQQFLSDGLIDEETFLRGSDAALDEFGKTAAEKIEKYVDEFLQDLETASPLEGRTSTATDEFLQQFEAAEKARKGIIRDGGVGGGFNARALAQQAGGRMEQLAAEQVNWLKKIDEAIKGLFPVYGA